MYLALVSCPDDCAERIERRILEKRLAASVTIVRNVTTTTERAGETTHRDGALLLLFTPTPDVDPLSREVSAICTGGPHPVISLQAYTTLESFDDWVKASTGQE